MAGDKYKEFEYKCFEVEAMEINNLILKYMVNIAEAGTTGDFENALRHKFALVILEDIVDQIGARAKSHGEMAEHYRTSTD